MDWNDFFNFRKMITPVIIKILFWLGVVAVVVYAFISMGESVALGLTLLILGPIMVRIYAELLMVVFAILDNLNLIRENLESRDTVQPMVETQEL